MLPDSVNSKFSVDLPGRSSVSFDSKWGLRINHFADDLDEFIRLASIATEITEVNSTGYDRIFCTASVEFSEHLKVQVFSPLAISLTKEEVEELCTKRMSSLTTSDN